MTWVVGDSREILPGYATGCYDLVLADPPYEDADLINLAVREGRRISRGAVVVFMYLEDLVHLAEAPDQVAVWVKPVSTKNTVKRLSRFVEAIAIWHGDYLSQDLHWSTRTGVFTDSLIGKTRHPHQKPESLIEKLMLLFCPRDGRVLDPFAGSGTVARVGHRLGYEVHSIEIDPGWLPGL